MSLRWINGTKKYLLKKDNSMVSDTNDGKECDITIGFSEEHKLPIKIYNNISWGYKWNH